MARKNVPAAIAPSPPHTPDSPMMAAMNIDRFSLGAIFSMYPFLATVIPAFNMLSKKKAIIL